MTDFKTFLTFTCFALMGAMVSAILTIANQPACFERQPAAYLRSDCSIKISKTLKEYSQECKQNRKKEK